MKRRKFIQRGSIIGGGLLIFPNGLFAKKDWPIIGHNQHRYRVVSDWGLLNPRQIKVKDCHEMVQDYQGRIILLTNETRNNVLIFDKSGKLLDSWGHDFPGAHGLTLHGTGKDQVLFITDISRHKVYKTTLDGRILMVLDYPKASGIYEKAEPYRPTETAIGPNGDIYITDGYGKQTVSQFDQHGNFIRIFGGAGKLWIENLHKWVPEKYPPLPEDFTPYPHMLNNAHGICLDSRKPNDPKLMVTSRMDNSLKFFSLDGKYLSEVQVKGAFVNRAVIKGKHVFASVLRSDFPSRDETGFVVILDQDNQVVSCPGGTAPEYLNDQLKQVEQDQPVFTHPHDVCIDDDENLYIPQWNSGKTLPIKLERV